MGDIPFTSDHLRQLLDPHQKVRPLINDPRMRSGYLRALKSNLEQCIKMLEEMGV